MAYYYLDNLSTTYNFDTNVLDIDLGTPKRKYNIEDSAGTHGGIITGLGNYEPRTIKVTKKFSTTSNTTWDATRTAFMTWINTSVNSTIYFCVKHNDGTTITRTRCYPSPGGSEKFKWIKSNEPWSFEFLCPKPYFENTTASTGSESVVDTTEHTFTVNNTGILDVPAIFTFTPTGAETMFQCLIADSFGFRLEGTFTAAKEISFNMANNSLTIDSISQNLNQFLTSGGIFNLAIGSQSIYVRCSGPGTFGYSFYTRFI